MKEIKLLNAKDISDKFGMNLEQAEFIFKNREAAPKHHANAHRSAMYCIGLVHQGEAMLKVGLNTYRVKGPGLLNVGADQIRQWELPTHPVVVTVLFFTEDFAVSGLADSFFLKKFSFFKTNGPHYVPLNETEYNAINLLFDLIRQKKDSGISGRLKSIQALLRALLLEVAGIHELNDKNHGSFSQAHVLTEKFKELLALQFKIQRSVHYYADQLSVTPKHLSQTIKSQTGKSVSEIINDIVCLEAKVLLQNKELNVAEIADQLSFANQSFFGKYFKRNTGMSPKQYREQLTFTKSDI